MHFWHYAFHFQHGSAKELFSQLPLSKVSILICMFICSTESFYSHNFYLKLSDDCQEWVYLHMAKVSRKLTRIYVLCVFIDLMYLSTIVVLPGVWEQYGFVFWYHFPPIYKVFPVTVIIGLSLCFSSHLFFETPKYLIFIFCLGTITLIMINFIALKG